ncbi:MAG: four-carbon acid sugar kinase family protein, partial [Candidatus Bathyarchaeia archaeon]
MKVLVVADDLTGACDAGVQFAESGLSTLVLTGPTVEFHGECDVLVVNSGTRNMDVKEAYNIVREVSECFKSSSEAYYKKIDSTMRGHVGAEVEAMLEGLGLRAAVLSPAYPENGRIVLGGHLFVNGRPLEKTEFIEHEEAGSYIPNLLGRETSSQVDCIDLSLTRRGAEAVRGKVIALIRRGSRIIVVDAVSRRDLEVIVEACSGVDKDILLCGSAGLAKELANHTIRKSGAILVVSGSLKRETLEQIKEAERRFSIKAFRLTPREILEGEPSGFLLDSLLEELKLRGIAVLTSALSRDDGIPGAEKTARRALSRAVSRILE